MKFRPLAIALVLVSAPLVCQAAETKTQGRQRQFETQIQPLLAKYCYECHGNGASEGDFAIDQYKSLQLVLEGRKHWLKVLQHVSLENMPPKTAEKRPTKEEYATLAKYVDTVLHDPDCSGPPVAGHVTLRRLTRYEYRNTVRDLIGVDYVPAGSFPADEVGYGFDNIGDVLSLPPLLLEKYLTAAEEVTSQAIITRPPPPAVVRDIRGNRLRAPGEEAPPMGGGRREEARALNSNGEVFTEIDFAADGDYILRTTAFGDQAGDEPPKMTLRLDGKDLSVFDVKNSAARATFEHTVKIPKGNHRIALAYTNDYYKPDEPDEKKRDRNLSITKLEVLGPIKTQLENLPATHTKLITVNPSDQLSWEEATKQVIRPFATRAFRRPVTDDELSRLVKISLLAKENGDNFETGTQLAVQAVMISPHFLFKVEASPDPTANKDAVRTISEYELATRLSYFLWSTMPDEELSALAAAGKLREGDTLEKQVRRLLGDNRSQALVENFATQWLTLRNLDTVQPNTRKFRQFNNNLRTAMRKETELFIGAVIRDDMSLLRLLDADFTFLNEPLATLYGIEDVKGNEFRKVSLAGTPRAGILTQASILTVTSNPTRTSPVKRGKWILENLLNEAPPPPPPNVPELKEERFLTTATLRERMQQHRQNAVCNSCHQTMDSLGFALENFDAVGAFRKLEGRFDIDATGELPSGEKFTGAPELRALLLNKKRKEFVACMTEKMLTYALGRGLEYYDQCVVNEIGAKLEKNDHRFSLLIVEIVNSYPFQHQGVRRE